MEPLVAEIERRFAELEAQLGDPTVLADQRRYAEVAREHKRLSGAAELARQWRERTAQVADAAELADDPDEEMRAFAQEQISEARAALPALEEEIRLAMLERDPADDKDVIVELRAGTGGDEAAIFAGDLYQMLTRYAQQRGFKTDTLSASGGDAGGYKELVFEIKGDGAYSLFKHESGVHRVQRVPATESQGRIHTSTATVAVMPEAEEVEVQLRPGDLEIQVYRSSGPGGQSVNTTDSAVRIVHKPTGIKVEVQEERSQLQNREKAMRYLRAKLYQAAREAARAKEAAARRAQLGSGERAEKIRTYNFPEGRVTDHRIKHTSHRLPDVLAGGEELDAFIDRLLAEAHAAELGGDGGG
jgi:peptide chain release factor 1